MITDKLKPSLLVLQLFLGCLALCFKQLQLRTNFHLLPLMLLCKRCQFCQIFLSDVDFLDEACVLHFEIVQLSVLLLEVELQDFEQLPVGDIIEGFDEFVGDVDIKEPSFLSHLNKQLMLLAWSLILSVTLVSVQMLMVVGAFLAILPQAQEYYNTNQTMVLLFSNAFNIFHVIITPPLFDSINRHYLWYVATSTAITGVAGVGRYFAGQNYAAALVWTSIIAIAHIPIITAPYGLLKLFPANQKGYAASIPLFLPVLGINFCILYGMTYISDGQGGPLSLVEVHNKISDLNYIIAVLGVVSSALTLFLLHKLKDQINNTKDDHQSTIVEDNSNEGIVAKVINFSRQHKLTIITMICWGTIVGINWTYGSLFGVIFEGQGLTGKQIALLGLAANLSTAFFSNLGTFIKNTWSISNTKVIGILNISGFIAAMLLLASRSIVQLQNINLLIALIIILRAGFSSFVSLAFIELELSGIPPVIVSGMFFWVANIVNLGTMELVDLTDVETSITLITLGVALCAHFVSETYIKNAIKN